MSKGKTIVLAEKASDVVIITPRSLNRARGIVAREVLVTRDIAGQPGYRALWHAIEPCFATTRSEGLAPATDPEHHAERYSPDVLPGDHEIERKP